MIQNANKSFVVIDIHGVCHGRMKYHEYLRSPWWKERADACKRAARWRCANCGGNKRLEAHHKHYANIGNELFIDLECLCRRCHQEEHEGTRINLFDFTK